MKKNGHGGGAELGEVAPGGVAARCRGALGGMGGGHTDTGGGTAKNQAAATDGTERGRAGPYGQSGCALRSREAWGALRGETGTSRPRNVPPPAHRGQGSEPLGCRGAPPPRWLGATSAPSGWGPCSVPRWQRPRLHLQPHGGGGCDVPPPLPITGASWRGAGPPPRRCDAVLAQPSTPPPGPSAGTYDGARWPWGSPKSWWALGRDRSHQMGPRGGGDTHGLQQHGGGAPTCSPLSPGMPGAPGSPGSPAQSGSGLSPCGERHGVSTKDGCVPPLTPPPQPTARPRQAPPSTPKGLRCPASLTRASSALGNCAKHWKKTQSHPAPRRAPGAQHRTLQAARDEAVPPPDPPGTPTLHGMKAQACPKCAQSVP